MCLMTLKIDAKFEKKKWFVVSKLTRIWWIFIQALKVSKIYALIGSLREKYVIFDLKKYRWVIFYDTRECPKFEEKRACGLDNNMRNLTNFHQSTWNWDSKLGLLWGTFIPSRKYMSLKFTGVLCVMTMNKGAKFEKESTSSKLTWGI